MTDIMRTNFIWLLTALALGCGNRGRSAPDIPSDGPQATDAPSTCAHLRCSQLPPSDGHGPPRALGMNDVTILLASDPSSLSGVATLNNNRGADFLSRDLFSRLVSLHGDIAFAFEVFHLAALRFDLCDRVAPGPCPEGAEGSLRLVFQPWVPGTSEPSDAAGLHAFYRIPAPEVRAVITDLREIAQVYGINDSIAPLGFYSDYSDDSPASRTFRNLLARYAVADQLIRLHVMARDSRSPTLRVVFRGAELHDGHFVDLVIPTLDVTEQVITIDELAPEYDVTPVADAPAGFALALTSSTFAGASPAEQLASLDALVATQNPLAHTASTVQCIACHVSTYLAVRRGRTANVNLRVLPSRYATTRDVRVTQGTSTDNHTQLRGFGWSGSHVAISQRVANETAQVLDEISQRFPALP